MILLRKPNLNRQQLTEPKQADTLHNRGGRESTSRNSRTTPLSVLATQESSAQQPNLRYGRGVRPAMNSDHTTRILIADDHPLFREGLRKLLEEEEGLEVVGQASDGEEAVRLACELKPDVVTVDIVMPKLNGLEAAKQIKESVPTTSILMLSAFDYESYLLQALRTGAAGFLSKGVRSTELISAIRAVGQGEPVLDPRAAYKVLARLVYTDDSDSKPILDELHERELEVLKLASQGMTNKEIAHELLISERTVQTHFMNIFRKLDASSRTEAVLKALKQRWITLDDLP